MRWSSHALTPGGTGRAWLVPLLIGLLVATASVVGLWWWVTTHQEFEPVLVASRTIPAYQVIQDADLRWSNAPKGSRQPGTVHNPKSVAGRIAKEPLYANEQIRGERLASSPLLLSAGERAIAVPSDLLRSVGGTVRPGDLVDVLWITKEDLPARLVAVSAVVLDLRTKDGHALFLPPAPATAPAAAVGSAVSQVAGQFGEAISATLPNAPQAAMATPVPGVVVLKVRMNEAPEVARALTAGQVVLAKAPPDSAYAQNTGR